MLSEDNVRSCILKASLGKRDRSDVRRVLENIDDYVFAVQEYLGDVDLEYKIPHHEPVKINDGISHKVRYIVKPTFDEQVVHHLLISVTKEIMMHGMYEYSCGSIPKRGGTKAKMVIEKYIKEHKNDGLIDYCLKIDIHHFFQSISHSKLKERISKYIRDPKIEYLFYQIIDAYNDHSSGNEYYGIPIGYYTSQWLANWYLQGLDHFIKQDLKAGLYVRYMDDMVIFGATAKELHYMKDMVEWYLNEVLDLEINDKWQVFRFDYIPAGCSKRKKHKGRFLDFVGFRFYRDRTILRKSLMVRATRKAKKIYKQKDCNWYEACQMISALGWFGHCNMRYCMQHRIRPYVDIDKIRRIISKHKHKMNQKPQDHFVEVLINKGIDTNSIMKGAAV